MVLWLVTLAIVVVFTQAVASKHKSELESFTDELQRITLEQQRDCDYTDSLQQLACQSYQSALGSLVIEGVELTKEVVQKRKEEILLRYVIEVTNQIPVRIMFNLFELKSNTSKKSFVFPSADPEICLTQEYGLCGNHTVVFMALMELVEIPARQIQFYYFDDGQYQSHSAAEVFIGKNWRFFDASYGSFYHEHGDFLHVVGIDQLRKQGKEAFSIKRNSSNLAALSYSKMKTLDSYLGTDVSIVYASDNGVIEVMPDRYMADGSIYMNHLPNYIGDNVDNGNFTGLSFLLKQTMAFNSVQIDVSAIAGCNAPESQICANDKCALVKEGHHIFNIEKERETAIFVNSPSRVCYAIVEGMTYQ